MSVEVSFFIWGASLNQTSVEDSHFNHLEGILHPDKWVHQKHKSSFSNSGHQHSYGTLFDRYEILKGLTTDDKLHIMGDLITKMDVDGDAEIEPSELATWIHYVEQTR